MEQQQDRLDPNETHGANSRAIGNQRLLYLALNHTVEFEREILSQRDRTSQD